jgi:hypothetical protein
MPGYQVVLVEATIPVGGRKSKAATDAATLRQRSGFADVHHRWS